MNLLSRQQMNAKLYAGSRSFWLASRFLAEDHRLDAAQLYSFCRYVDDLADEAWTSKQQIIQRLRSVQNQLRQTAPVNPDVKAYLEVAYRCNLGIEPALHLIDGMLADQRKVRIADDAQLLRYCYQVAGTVGVMMCKVLGIRDEALPQAVDLGIAMQLTNICRDVAEDAKMDRVYLPKDRLGLAGVEQEELIYGCESSTGVAVVMGELLNLAEQYYRSAEQAFVYIPIRSRLAIVVATRVYRAIGLRLAQRGCNYRAGRTIVPPWEKVYWIGHSLLETVDPRALGLYPPVLHDSWLHRFIYDLPGTHSYEAWKNVNALSQKITS